MGVANGHKLARLTGPPQGRMVGVAKRIPTWQAIWIEEVVWWVWLKDHKLI